MSKATGLNDRTVNIEKLHDGEADLRHSDLGLSTSGETSAVPFADLVTPHLELEEELVSVFRSALIAAGLTVKHTASLKALRAFPVTSTTGLWGENAFSSNPWTTNS